ncbi:transmembrane protein 47-like [Mauremys reevesii]|uniref:transmembrane protein 47-like n=1 Tax=Mauremys reevesii TaxID=260615 RepID=UPI00193F683E|nr:transmembrane protein 47-like [Mauremys reevesii]
MEPRSVPRPEPAATMETRVPMPGTASEAPPSRGPWPLRCLGAGTTCCSLALLLCAVLSPRWLLIDSEDDGYHSGVWWLCSRPVCAGIITETSSFKAIRALLLFALLASCVAVASLLVSVRPFARWRGAHFLLSATANFIAGLLVLISVVIFTAHVMLDSVNPQARASFQWAFFLAWTLCPLFVLSGILALFVHSSCPGPSPRVGPWGQPSQDLEETPAPGGLEGGPGAEPLPLGQDAARALGRALWRVCDGAIV